MRLYEAMIADQSCVLLDGLGQEAVGLFLAVERKLAAMAAPDVTWRMATADTGLVQAFLGKRRDLLVIEHRRLREYAVLISCRAYGAVLHVAWMVLVTPRLANDLHRALRFNTDRGSRFEIGAELDVFDVADLKAFIGITRLALRAAIRELTDDEPDDQIPVTTQEQA